MEVELLVKAGNSERAADAISSVSREVVPAASQSEPTLVAPVEQSDDQSIASLATAAMPQAEGEEEDELAHRTRVARSTKALSAPVPVVPAPVRRAMPRPVRRALLLFCIVGTLALCTDGILLALSFTRHHTPFALRYVYSNSGNDGTGSNGGNSGGVIKPQVVAGATATASAATPAARATQLATASSLVLSSSRLTFSATQGQTTLSPEIVAFSTGGQGAFSWQVAPVGSLPSWLQLSATQGKASTGASATLTVSASPAQLSPGFYTTTLQVTAADSQGKALLDSPQSLVVTLTISTSHTAACVLGVSPTKLSFASVLLSTPQPQTLTLTPSDCAFPVSWQISTDVSWLTFSRSSGSMSSSGSSLSVQASSAGKLIGSYTAHITVRATDSSGASATISPVTITATLTVIG